ASSATIRPSSYGRVIFQFRGYRSADFYMDEQTGCGDWPERPLFCRWRFSDESPEFQNADAGAMQNVRHVGYHRVILSAFQWLKDPLLIAVLRQQCRGLRIHHETSARFDGHSQVDDYLTVLSRVYDSAAEITA